MHDHGVEGECLAQGKADVEQFWSIVVSGLGRNARGQIQIVHSDDTVAKAYKSLSVPCLGGSA